MDKPFTHAAIALLALVALAHLCRAVAGWDVMIDGFNVPLWVSGVATVIAASLASMVWREARS